MGLEVRRSRIFRPLKAFYIAVVASAACFWLVGYWRHAYVWFPLCDGRRIAEVESYGETESGTGAISIDKEIESGTGAIAIDKEGGASVRFPLAGSETGTGTVSGLTANNGH